jgi:hypothetical protein
MPSAERQGLGTTTERWLRAPASSSVRPKGRVVNVLEIRSDASRVERGAGRPSSGCSRNFAVSAVRG